MKSIYSLIHENLKKTLVLSLGSTALVLVVFSYFSINAMEKSATTFIMKHTARLAEVGINTQNVADIEKEVSRFVESWKETQDLDIRIDLLIDDKLIAHAGQLQPFGILSSNVTQEVNLPSGQNLVAHVQISLLETIILRGLELLIFEAFFLAVYFFLTSNMKRSLATLTKPLEDRVEWLKSVASKLPESAKELPPFAPAKVKEVDDLSHSITVLLSEILNLENNLAQVNFDKGRVLMAEKVAHNIKAAIAILQLKINQLPHLSEVERKELLKCVDSIRDVSVNLLKAKKEDKTLNVVASSSHTNKVDTDLYALVRSAFKLKQEQYQNLKGLTFDYFQISKLLGHSFKIVPTEMHSVFENLIDNAVDALPNGQGVISLGVSMRSQELEIKISDNGKGIPQDVLKKLLIVGGTYGKEHGSGIGLTHAKETLAQLNGHILLESIEGESTTVTLKIPREDSLGREFVDQISIGKDSLVLIIDDDFFVHETWKYKFLQSGIKNKMLHFYSPEEFNQWVSKNGLGTFGSRHYFFDYDLKDKYMNGLDLIEQHGIGLESLLVSGLAEEVKIFNRAQSLGTKCLKKDFLEDTPIKVVFPEEKSLSVGALSETYNQTI